MKHLLILILLCLVAATAHAGPPRHSGAGEPANQGGASESANHAGAANNPFIAPLPPETEAASKLPKLPAITIPVIKPEPPKTLDDGNDTVRVKAIIGDHVTLAFGSEATPELRTVRNGESIYRKGRQLKVQMHGLNVRLTDGKTVVFDGELEASQPSDANSSYGSGSNGYSSSNTNGYRR